MDKMQRKRPRGRRPKLTAKQAEEVAGWFADGMTPAEVRDRMAATEGMPTVDIRTIYRWLDDLHYAIEEEARAHEGYHRIAAATTILQRERYLQHLIATEKKLRPLMDAPGRHGTYPVLGKYLATLELIGKAAGHFKPVDEGEPINVTPQAARLPPGYEGMSAEQIRALNPHYKAPTALHGD